MTVELGDVAQVLANEVGAVEVVALFEEQVEAIAFVIFKQTDIDAGQQVGLAGNCRAKPVQGSPDGSGKFSCSQSPHPGVPASSIQMKQPWGSLVKVPGRRAPEQHELAPDGCPGRNAPPRSEADQYFR